MPFSRSLALFLVRSIQCWRLKRNHYYICKFGILFIFIMIFRHSFDVEEKLNYRLPVAMRLINEKKYNTTTRLTVAAHAHGMPWHWNRRRWRKKLQIWSLKLRNFVLSRRTNGKVGGFFLFSLFLVENLTTFTIKNSLDETKARQRKWLFLFVHNFIIFNTFQTKMNFSFKRIFFLQSLAILNFRTLVNYSSTNKRIVLFF